VIEKVMTLKIGMYIKQSDEWKELNDGMVANIQQAEETAITS
jgi:hypothetical protein